MFDFEISLAVVLFPHTTTTTVSTPLSKFHCLPRTHTPLKQILKPSSPFEQRPTVSLNFATPSGQKSNRKCFPQSLSSHFLFLPHLSLCMQTLPRLDQPLVTFTTKGPLAILPGKETPSPLPFGKVWTSNS